MVAQVGLDPALQAMALTDVLPGLGLGGKAIASVMNFITTQTQSQYSLTPQAFLLCVFFGYTIKVINNIINTNNDDKVP